MTDQHPITPPPELVGQWFLGAKAMPVDQWVTDVATQAARWGADQELEACCEWFQEFYKSESWVKNDLKHFRNARRPKLPSLKDLAIKDLNYAHKTNQIDDMLFYNILKALEQLND